MRVSPENGTGIGHPCDAALAAARERYAVQHPLSLARYVQSLAAMPVCSVRNGPRYMPFPVALVRGEGCEVWDADGIAYLDFDGNVYGHNHPVIAHGIRRGMETGLPSGQTHEFADRLACCLCERVPGIGQVIFAGCACEARSAAIALARKYTGRLPCVLQVGAGESDASEPGIITCDANDTRAMHSVAAQSCAEIAAIVLPPILKPHCIPAEPGFAAAAREAADRAGALLIFDETALPRLLPEDFRAGLGIDPDLIALDLRMGGPFPLGALGAKAGVLDALTENRPQEWLPSPAPLPVLSAALAGFTEVYTAAAAKALNARGDCLRDRLNALCLARRGRIEFTGAGAMLGARPLPGRVGSSKPVSRGETKMGALFHFGMLERGIRLGPDGQILLSLAMRDQGCDALLHAVEALLVAEAEMFVAS
ncbi:MAG: aminotransferase class III-fold pyridoxal phosphate-dependent enzyme [Acetobacteraceae bacterium]|nr:aminotransferase class III-fold pyridoxal phosphate-dependent enzyme [Acetobacteraceae bacterium]